MTLGWLKQEGWLEVARWRQQGQAQLYVGCVMMTPQQLSHSVAGVTVMMIVDCAWIVAGKMSVSVSGGGDDVGYFDRGFDFGLRLYCDFAMSACESERSVVVIVIVMVIVSVSDNVMIVSCPRSKDSGQNDDGMIEIENDV